MVSAAIDGHRNDRARDLEAGTDPFTGRIGVVGCDPTAEDHRVGRAGSPTGHGQNGHQNAASGALGEVGGVKPLE